MKEDRNSIDDFLDDDRNNFKDKYIKRRKENYEIRNFNKTLKHIKIKLKNIKGIQNHIKTNLTQTNLWELKGHGAINIERGFNLSQVNKKNWQKDRETEREEEKFEDIKLINKKITTRYLGRLKEVRISNKKEKTVI